MLFKIRSINELFRFSGNRHLGGEEKKSVVLEKNIYFNETTRVKWIEANRALKIIIFRYFAFFLELTFYFLLFIPQADHPLLVGAVVDWNLSNDPLLFIEEIHLNNTVAIICSKMQNLKQIFQ